MVTIENPMLTVERVEGAPGRRRLVVSYRLTLEASQPVEVDERAVVTSRDVLDAPVSPEPLQVDLVSKAELGGGVHERLLSAEVDKTELDVQRDWWQTDHGGGVVPIAELLDHLGCVITVRIAGAEQASATTPIVTGSWGALGRD